MVSRAQQNRSAERGAVMKKNMAGNVGGMNRIPLKEIGNVGRAVPAAEGIGKKARPAFSSIQNARSKIAYWMSKMPPKEEETVVDINGADAMNQLAVTKYVDDLYRFYKVAEKERMFGDYMNSQPDINEKMRAIVIDWLTEVHLTFQLNPETLYLTINIFDRYLSVRATPRKELQLLGMGAMILASKYEEIWAPEVNDFVCISNRAYTHAEVLAMEKQILSELEWNLTVPTPYVFLARFIKASIPDSEDMENMVYFLAELGMMNYKASLYCPSMLAASAVYTARCTLRKTPLWDATMRFHTGFTEAELVDCARLLVSCHGEYADHRLKAIFNKYSSPRRGSMALFPPANSLLA